MTRESWRLALGALESLDDVNAIAKFGADHVKPNVERLTVTVRWVSDEDGDRYEATTEEFKRSAVGRGATREAAISQLSEMLEELE